MLDNLWDVEEVDWVRYEVIVRWGDLGDFNWQEVLSLEVPRPGVVLQSDQICF